MNCPGFTLKQREILCAEIRQPLFPKMLAGRSQNPFAECGGLFVPTGGDLLPKDNVRLMMKILNALLAFCLLLNSVASLAAEKADLVVVEKSKNRLSLYRNGELLASYHVVFGGNPTGPKERQGDGKTPEGRYILDSKKSNSAYYKAFHVSYPNQQDLARAKKMGVSPGGDIMVHGQKNGLSWLSFLAQRVNWTKGCIALSNADIDAMWKLVDAGTPIDILP
ncbi:MAG: L,D-transpeptidase family protein [Thermodesulfobacteriota bacterium]